MAVRVLFLVYMVARYNGRGCSKHKVVGGISEMNDLTLPPIFLRMSNLPWVYIHQTVVLVRGNFCRVS